MFRRIRQIFLIYILFSQVSTGQESDYGPGFQNIMMDNPAFSGSEGDGILRLSYMNFFPGNSYNFHSVYSSFDAYFEPLHGGAGFYISDDYLGGIINDLRGGLSYAYFLQAGRNFFINAGLSASVYHRGFNFGNAVLPDQIDPLGGVSLPSAEALASGGQTAFDIGAGFLFYSENYFGGFSISHLAEPDLSESGSSDERLKRKYQIQLSGNINLNESQSLKIRPLFFAGLQDDYISASAGATFESNNLSINTLVLGDNGRNMNVQTGFSFKAGLITVYYNYRFNISSGNSLMPLSLMHQTGLAFCLNKVEKRNSVRTINFPKL